MPGWSKWIPWVGACWGRSTGIVWETAKHVIDVRVLQEARATHGLRQTCCIAWGTVHIVTLHALCGVRLVS